MATSFFVEDAVALRDDPSMLGTVGHSWRDIEAGRRFDFDDLIFHKGVPKGARAECLRENRPPKGYVVVDFIFPYEGAALVKESALLLVDRSLAVGNVVKRKATDAESGTILNLSVKCTIEPIYKGLPFSGSDPWPYKEEENRVHNVPALELKFLDYRRGDYILFKGWIGEIVEVYEEVSLRLKNGSIVKVKDAEKLKQPHPAYFMSTSKVDQLTDLLASQLRAGDSKVTELVDLIYPGEELSTTKGNLRLGQWIFGAYDPSQEPVGTVVDCKVDRVDVDWITSNFFNHTEARVILPPHILESDELEQVKIYSRNQPGLNQTDVGSRQHHDMRTGDLVRFRDISGAALKYSGPANKENGSLRRIPRTSTQEYDMNVFRIKSTQTMATVQWQDTTRSEHDATTLLPYLNVDEFDVWPGEIVVFKDGHFVEGTRSAIEIEEGSIRPKRVGVVQSYDARERIARVRWFANPDVGIFEAQQTTLVPGSTLGELSSEETEVSCYEIITYPALAKRPGDLVLVSPRPSAMQAVFALQHASPGLLPAVEAALEWNRGQIAPEISVADAGSDDCTWFGEVVDLRMDGRLTVRLGALDLVRDITVDVEMVIVMVSEDYTTMTSEDSVMDDDDSEDDNVQTSQSESEIIIEEIVEYEGGARIDEDGDEDLWMTDVDEEEEDDEDAEEEEEDDDDDNDENQSGIGDDFSQSEEMNSTSEPHNSNDSAQVQPTITRADARSKVDRLEEYHFESFQNMPARFLILDDPPPPDHHYDSTKVTLSASLLRRIRKEHGILEALPDGIWIRTWIDRLDLFRVLIIGPRGTPYELSPFVLDIQMHEDYPHSPPHVFFHSWTKSVGKINPNLYEDGIVCLSILGTWSSERQHESWSAERSSILQVVVSLLGLVLVAEPFYNEAGFEALIGSEESRVSSALYNEKAMVMSKGFVVHALSHPISALDDVLEWLYLKSEGPQLLKTVFNETTALIEGRRGVEGSAHVISTPPTGQVSNSDGIQRLSAGALILLRPNFRALKDRLEKLNND